MMNINDLGIAPNRPLDKVFDLEKILFYINQKLDWLNVERKQKIAIELDLDKNNLEEALTKCSARIYYYGLVENEIASWIEYLDLYMKSYEAQFLKDWRKTNEKLAFKEKEADIRRIMFDDSTWVNLLEVKRLLDLVKSEFAVITRAFDAQSRLLMSANKRDMFQANLS